MKQGYLMISEVAHAAGVNVQTLRYYERRGILKEPSRTSGGYRQYPEETIRLIRFIKRAQELGFTLKEVQGLLRLRKARGERERVRHLAQTKRELIAEKIRSLESMQQALDLLISSCLCSDTKPECPILEALEE